MCWLGVSDCCMDLSGWKGPRLYTLSGARGARDACGARDARDACGARGARDARCACTAPEARRMCACTSACMYLSDACMRLKCGVRC